MHNVIEIQFVTAFRYLLAIDRARNDRESTTSRRPFQQVNRSFFGKDRLKLKFEDHFSSVINQFKSTFNWNSFVFSRHIRCSSWVSFTIERLRLHRKALRCIGAQQSTRKRKKEELITAAGLMFNQRIFIPKSTIDKGHCGSDLGSWGSLLSLVFICHLQCPRWNLDLKLKV